MTYNKKQMQPLIDKYAINPETNKLFTDVCEMFDGQPNYQIWAVKMVFSKSLSIEQLETIHEWVGKNQTLVKSLEKQNIVSYSSKNAILKTVIHILFETKVIYRNSHCHAPPFSCPPRILTNFEF